jgi:hypothetical protein
MILGKKRSNLATPLYPILENASLSIQYYFFCLRSYIGSNAYNGNANDIITIPFDRDKTNITWVTMTNTILYLSKQWRNYFK